jgi:hypothetical protein
MREKNSVDILEDAVSHHIGLAGSSSSATPGHNINVPGSSPVP